MVFEAFKKGYKDGTSGYEKNNKFHDFEHAIKLLH